ncbi:CDP-diacylglycerol-glycerol-3-phosphate 3-phosphatidyltransferase [Thecamonas trahens ATCC 50062]|uniref:CDP-diacylglycerol-glycerol-3-phosphate 3-phosphatidyltransferase n=1 Tax=Thecamonas trahens ATCC 50062 TaxID=461836 RepID=A0A0L0D648_THETB|nr:CDP-diacylglycerol-glycerol-3-phosphate 3-phosphatidyltransferase [Thecamonas trahens ATCC 50062]KNC46788.1 CDP-diacylglycerol-glycerol-3-phosphate 3-phosphatidyltransferase [Thecamonas trahens ATCC 50062]|eukprot:XP_013760063.1 CDP-diacylglycerol-glycerol-3-phosphate 3-phosphatidyltransferase [Thecamonas trahens ATCC 50062]
MLRVAARVCGLPGRHAVVVGSKTAGGLGVWYGGRCMGSGSSPRGGDDGEGKARSSSGDGSVESVAGPEHVLESKVIEAEGSNWNIPNALCVGRMVATPVIAAALVQGHPQTAFWMFAAAGVSDWADGKIAVHFKQKTVLGSFLDPAADKIMVMGMSLAMGAAELLPWWLVASFVVRDVGLLAGAFYLRARSLGDTLTVRALFNVSGFKSLEITPSRLSKFNTFGQISVIGLTLMDAAFGIVPSPLLAAAYPLVTATTLASGASYALTPGIKRLVRRPQ